MSGDRLAAAALAAAAVVYRHGVDCSIVAFSDEAVVLSSQGEHRADDELVGDRYRPLHYGWRARGLLSKRSVPVSLSVDFPGAE